MNADELRFLLLNFFFFTIILCFCVWGVSKGIKIWLEKTKNFNKCKAIKEEKGFFNADPISCALMASLLINLASALIKVSLPIFGVNHHIIEVIEIVLRNVPLMSFIGIWFYLTYQSHLIEVKENARFLVLDTLFHNELHTFRFNGKNLQGAMQDLLKAEMITPYGSSFSNTGIVYQLTQKGRNAYQEYLEVEAEKEALILPTSQVISSKQMN